MSLVNVAIYKQASPLPSSLVLFPSSLFLFSQPFRISSLQSSYFSQKSLKDTKSYSIGTFKHLFQGKSKWGVGLQASWCLCVCLFARYLTVSVSALTGNWLKNVKTPLEQHGRKWHTWWMPWTAAMQNRALCMEKIQWLWLSWTLTTTTTDVRS